MMRLPAPINRRLPISVALVSVLTTTAHANPISDQIAALTEEKRQTIFARMMQREGERCSDVSRTFFQGSANDRSAFWSISCTGGKDWQIMIKNTAQGDIKMLDCATLKAVGGGQCFVAFKSKK
jgi:hypothetical protein